MKHLLPRLGATLLLLGGLLHSPLARAQAPANDDPCGAITLTSGGASCGTPTSATNVGATTTTPNGYQNPSPPPMGGCGTAAAPKDVWFQFTTAASGPASFGAALTVTGAAAGQIRLFSAASCAGPFTQVACSGTAPNTAAPRLSTGLLAPSTTYYVSVAGYGPSDAAGAFTICLSNGPATPGCGTPTINSAGITFPTPTSVSIPFTPGINSAPPYTVSILAAGLPTQTQTVSSSPAVFTGLTPGYVYNVAVTNTCAGGGQATGVANFTRPVTNDEPCTAIALPSLSPACTPITGSATGATTSVAAGTGGCGGPGLVDVWYTFRTAATGPGSTSAVIQTTGDAAREIRLFSAAACTGPLTARNCILSSTGPGGTTTGLLTATGLTPNTTYYLSIADDGLYAGFTRLFTLCVTNAPPCNVTMNAPVVSAITGTGAQLSYGNASVTPTSYLITYTAAGGMPVTVTAGGLTSRLALSGLLPNTTYTVSVVAVCTGGGQSQPLTTTFTTSNVPAPANDNPCGAISLPINATCTPVSGTTVGANGTNLYTGAPRSACGEANPAVDVWYSFTTTASGPGSRGVIITATGGAAGQLWAFSASSCSGPFTFVDCSGTPASATPQPAPPLILTGLLPSTTYYLRVSDFDGGLGSTTGGPFTLCLTPSTTCNDPGNLVVGSITTTSAQLTFTPAAGAVSYRVSYGPTGQPPVSLSPNPTGSPVNLTGLVQGTSYTVTVQTVCGTGLGLPITATFRTLGVGAPANDECLAATPIPTLGQGMCGPQVNSTTALATASLGVANPGCANYQTGDVWFSAVVPANGVVQFNTGAGTTPPSMSDSGMALYVGSCGSLTEVACNDDTNGLFSQVRFQGLMPGSTVYVRVWSFGSSTQGSFTICGQTDAACPAVTNLVVGNTTTTTATLSFTGPVNASSYTVTLTPPTGAPIVLTATSSPFTATGLQQGTRYGVSIVTNCGGGLTSLPTVGTLLTAPACPPPTALTVTNITTTTAQLFFLPSTAGTSYVVTLTPLVGAPITLTATTSPLALTGLLPNTRYSVSMVANCAGGLVSAASPATIFTTTSPCPAVTNVVVNPLTATGGSVIFTGPTAALGYTLTLTPATGAPITLTASTAPVQLTGLQPSTRYTLSIVANCAGGLTSTPTPFVFFTPTAPPCAAPTSVSIINTNVSTATVAFTPSPSATSYTVSYFTGGGPAQMVSPNPTSSPVVLTGLRPGLIYTVSIVSNCAGGLISPTTVPLSFLTMGTSTRAATLAAQVRLAPNPAHQAVVLTLPVGARPGGAWLLNNLGQQLRHYELVAGTGSGTELDLRGLPPGVYALRLSLDGEQLVKRLVVE